MLKAFAGFLLAFLMFGAAGYKAGRDAAGGPERVSAYIASRTTVKLNPDRSLVMVFSGKNNVPYWRYDLKHKIATFNDAPLLERSLKPKALSAESEQLLKFVGGGAVLALTAKDVVSFLLKKEESTNTRTKLMIVLGGATGFLLGYKIGISSVDYDSIEVLSFVRKPENITLIQRLVFASMYAAKATSFHVAVLDASEQKPASAPPDCAPNVSRVDCLLNSPNWGNTVWKAQTRLDLLNRGLAESSLNGGSFDETAFLAFFM